MLAGGGGVGREIWWIYSNTFKRLPLNLIDCRSKSDFDRKLSSAQLEGNGGSNGRNYILGRLRLKCDGTRAETRFLLSEKRTSPFKLAGASVQSTTGSRGVRISGSNAAYTKFRGSVESTGYPLHSPVSLHFPSHASPCAITFQLDSTRIVLIEPINSADMQCLCCYQRKPKEANEYVMPKLRITTALGINENKQERHHAETQAC